MDLSSLFATFTVDREPAVLADLLGLFQAWLQDAGAYMFICMGAIIFFMWAYSNSKAASNNRNAIPTAMLAFAALAILCFAGYLAFVMRDLGVDVEEKTRRELVDPTGYQKIVPPQFSMKGQSLLLSAAGLFSILGICVPFVAGLVKLRFQRIYALAKLTVIEVIRNRIFLALGVVLIPVLFPLNWFIPMKPEHELKNTVQTSLMFIQVLILFISALVASFAIPKDVKDQNIYTIITKPVEPFEILLGRFFGYVAVASFVLFMLIFGSWCLIQFTGNFSEQAQDETFKARVPVRGKLSYMSRKGVIEGIDAGREFNYRKYIAGHPASSQRAIYSLYDLPESLKKSEQDAVPLEFTFDIFRLTKGEENRGVDVNIRVTTWQCRQLPPPQDAAGTGNGIWRWESTDGKDREADYEATARIKMAAVFKGQPNDTAYSDPVAKLTQAMFDMKRSIDSKKPASESTTKLWAIANELAEEFGFFEIRTKEVYDMHPEQVLVPAKLFINADKGTPPKVKDGPPEARIKVYVKCTSASQMLGMADGDLYFLEAQQKFWQNYLKAGIGVWCLVVIVIGIAICTSTYITGIVSFLVTGFFFILGVVSPFLLEITSVSGGKATVGGPLVSLNQMLQAKSSTSSPDETAMNKAMATGDLGYEFIVRRVMCGLPDVYAFDWTPYVMEGFNIPTQCVIVNLLTVIAYLLPWFIIGFYLIRSREVAA